MSETFATRQHGVRDGGAEVLDSPLRTAAADAGETDGPEAADEAAP